MTHRDRADAAERSVLARHVRPLWLLPGTRLGVVSAPASTSRALFLRWHYWWQAHLLDCAVDAHVRAPDPARRARVRALVRGIRVRNLGGRGGPWSNRYFDDMAWLGLALQRAGELVGVARPAAVTELTGHLLAAWSDEAGGGIPWRRGDDFRNAPANGPAAILLARTGHLNRAEATADWIHARLLDPATGLVLDGIRPGGRLERSVFTYNQGTAIGAGTELAVRTGGYRHRERVHHLVTAVADRLSSDGVLRTHDGGDGGLFTGILARNLALVATTLPGTTAADREARATAARLVLTSAGSLWHHRARTRSGVVFGVEWARPARPDAPGSSEQADLSVQLSAWMLLEAAATVAGPSPEPPA